MSNSNANTTAFFIRDTKPPVFKADVPWNVWKMKFRGWLRANDLLKLIEDAETETRNSGSQEEYGEVIRKLAAKKDEEKEKKALIGYYLMKALDNESNDKILSEVAVRDDTLMEDGCVLWCCLLVLREAKTVVKKDLLLQEITNAKIKPGETVHAFGLRIRQVALQLAQADSSLKQADAMVVQFILRGLPDHFELWKEAFRGRAPEQQSLPRLLLDLEKEAAEEECGNGQQAKVSAMFKAAGISRTLYQGGAMQDNRRETCDNCGGYHALRKCSFRGKCFKCEEYGHKAKFCKQEGERGRKSEKEEMKKEGKRVKFQGVKMTKSIKQLKAMKSLEGDLVPSSEDRQLLNNQNVWGLDSCSEEHSTPFIQLLHDVETTDADAPAFEFGDGEILRPSHKGKAIIRISNTDGEEAELELYPVYYIAKSPCNLLSTSALKEKGHGFHQPAKEDSYCLFGGHFCVPVMMFGRVPLLVAKNSKILISKTTWHRRLNHISHQHINALESEVEGLCVDQKDDYVNECDACPAGKSKRPPFPKKATNRTTACNQLVHTDLSGKMPRDINGYQYAHIMVDDFSREGLLNLLHFRSEAPQTLETWEKKYDTPGMVRSDNAPELTAGRWEKKCNEKKIYPQTTCPYTPQQNGVAERRLAVLEADAKAMCAQAELPYQDFWGYAQKAANHVRNLIISKADGVLCPPQKKRTGLKPDISCIRIFGCIAYVHLPKGMRKKADLRARRGIFVGYSENQKGYIVLDPTTGKEIISRDVEFHEGQPGGLLWHNKGWKGLPIPQEEEEEDEEQEPHTLVLPELQAVDPLPIQNAALHDQDMDDVSSESPLIEENQESPASEEEYIGDSRRSSRVRNPPQSAYNPNVIFTKEKGKIVLQNLMKAVDVRIPRNHKEAMASSQADHWRRAEEDEINGLQSKNAFKIVDIPKKANLLGSRFIYALKKDEKGFVTRFKARLVAKGYTQKQGRDYFKTYAPVGNRVGHRVFLAVAASRKKIPRNVDVTQAFINADIDVPLYLRLPDGMKAADGKCAKLDKSLYGTKQASRNWYLTVKDWLTLHGWEMFCNDECLWRKDDDLLFFHVDDFHYLGSDKSFQEWFQSFSSTFPAKDLGKSKQILGMNLTYYKDGSINLNQERYILECIHEMKMQNAKPDAIPARVNGKEEKDESPYLDEDVPFRAGIGKLHHMIKETRPDIMYAVSVIASKQNNPTRRDWIALKKIYKYLIATSNRGLLFRGGCNLSIKAWCDADFAGDREDRKSRSGYIVTVGGTPVDWYSKKQDVVALSTAEAEYIAMSKVGQAVLFVSYLVEFMTRTKIENPIKIYADNQAAIAIVEKPSTVHGRSKHIPIKYHFIRQLVDNESICFEWTSSEKNLADALTKPLGRIAFARCWKNLLFNPDVTEEECQDGH